MCGCQKNKKMAKVGKAKYMNFDFEELATMAVGGLAAKALVNPLSKVLLKNAKNDAWKKYFPLVVKGGLTVALNMIDDRRAKTAAKGAAVATLFEAVETIAPSVFAPRFRASVDGYDDDLINAIEIDLSDINGTYDDYDGAGVMGVGSYESAGVM
jgi:hypothetical protein